MRLDTALVARGLVSGRNKAKQAIEGGAVTVNGHPVRKASFQIDGGDVIDCSARERYVGRGGEKLEHLFACGILNVGGAVCADIGASTGGFTDCLLRHGAAHVYALDVGHGQLDLRLVQDPRVTSLEGTDIRDTEKTAVIPGHSVRVCTVDVSFISITKIFDRIPPLLTGDGEAVCLIKPQFEAGREALSKRGVVTDVSDHIRVLRSLTDFWNRRGWNPRALVPSPILGKEGNAEYLAVLTRSPSVCADIGEAVKQAMSLRGKERPTA